MASACTVMLSAPARAMSCTCCSGRSTIMWTSSSPLDVVHQVGQRPDDQRPEGDRRDEMTVHHVDVDHPGAGVEHLLDLRPETREVRRQDRRSDPQLAQSRPPPLQAGHRQSHSDGLEHAAVAVVAGHDRGARHAHDRRMLTAVRAHRHQLVALQAVDAAIPAREQPSVAATAPRSRGTPVRACAPVLVRSHVQANGRGHRQSCAAGGR